jgi:hypothetical protein
VTSFWNAMAASCGSGSPLRTPADFVLRRDGVRYAAIVDEKDWPYRIVDGLWELAS